MTRRRIKARIKVRTATKVLPVPEVIRQIEAKALRKLRHPSRSERLRSFLDQDN